MQTKDLEIRYSEAIKAIGGASALITLPENIKALLRNTTDLEFKVLMLEEIAKRGGNR